MHAYIIRDGEKKRAAVIVDVQQVQLLATPIGRSVGYPTYVSIAWFRRLSFGRLSSCLDLKINYIGSKREQKSVTLPNVSL